MAADLVSPDRFTGPEVAELLAHHWPDMERTRANAEETSSVIAGTDAFVMPTTITIAGADQYVAGIPHPRTVPSRMLQELISDRPHLSIPLGPKGLGISGQRLTTRVELPLNAICEDGEAGVQWDQLCALLAFEGFAASVTVLDPADWQKRPSAWENDAAEIKSWKRQYARDASGRTEEDANYGGVDDTRSATAYKLALDVHRARNVPIRHRAVGIRNCAPLFGPNLSVEGLLISNEFSESYLRRKFRFGEAGVLTPTGGSSQSSGTSIAVSRVGRTLTLIEAWLYDEDGLPYVSYCVKGARAVAAEWKGGSYDGQMATLDLKTRFGLDRLPIDWRFGLGNPAESNPDLRAMGVLEPFIQGWRSVRAKLTANNWACMLAGYPILIEESDGLGVSASMETDDDPPPAIEPGTVLPARPGMRLRQLEIQPISDAVFKQIELELGANADETPGKSNKDQSGFSQSMAKAFEDMAMTTVRQGLAKLYERHGSFVLEAGKRLPEMRRSTDTPGSGWAPIMVFASTDVPTNETQNKHNDPMILDPDLIDETFTAKARYAESMSIPEEQQAMEEVARKLMTRRNFLEKKGDEHPEETELELMLEEIRSTPEYQQYALSLMAKVQGSEELADLTKAKDEGLANQAGMSTGLAHGVAPAPPPGMLPPMQTGAPGVPVGGSVTGGAPPNYGASALGGVVAGGGMQGPISGAAAAGGVVPPNLPTPQSVGAM